MRRAFLFSVDLCLVLAASGLAFLLRENFELSAEKLQAFLPYLACTLAIAALIVPVLGLSRSVWRFSTMTDYLYLVGATVAIVLGAVVLGFTLNRLEGVARSIPLLQGIMVLLLLVGARVFMRLRHANWRGRAAQFSLSPDLKSFAKSSILIVGLNRLTELYLQSAHEMSAGAVHIAGLIGRDARHTGRLMHRYPVLGAPEQLSEILKSLAVHGVFVERIIVTETWNGLSQDAQAALRDMEQGSDVQVEFLAQTLGFDPSHGTVAEGGSRTSQATANPARALRDGTRPREILAISAEERELLKDRRYWAVKRAIDVVGALILILVLAPVMALVAALVWMDVGRPLLFWQQRPGLGGRPFRLYKLRTMRPAHDAQGRVIPDAERLSAMGQVLRRTRLDELPQLFQILNGQMSFVGPRPLLPVDQPVGTPTRLLVRPGLTGWAQVGGGRALTVADKAALDVWYVRHASLKLDMEIVWRTVGLLIFGETANPDALRKAWGEALPAESASEVLRPAPIVVAKGRSGGRQVA